jgi:16S rRNA (adenine1518-N6/adenine1519-N6)-dimethyltransferase
MTGDPFNYNSAAALRAFLEARNLGMRKKFGQNFLINPGIRRALVEALRAEPESELWEIGPGLGAMTSLLLEKGLIVRAFEIDEGFAGALRELFADDQGFTLVQGDVMKTWPTAAPAPFLLGNLPYNIAAALLGDFIEQGRFFKRMVVTVQREVALRMAALPGSADYSSFSLLCASAYTVKPLMLIRPASFYPRPNVDSQGVLLERRTDVGPFPPLFYPLIRGLFASRRKMIKNNLVHFLASRRNGARVSSQELAMEALGASGIDGDLRAENLALEGFVALAKIIEDMEN